MDVITTAGQETIRALQQATKTIPIVGMAGDMLGDGFVNSLARPNGNTTGVSILVQDLDGKRQDILIEAVPGLRCMAVLADVNYTKQNVAKVDALQTAARAHDVELLILRVANGDQIAAAIDGAQTSGATALNIWGSPLFFANRHQIMERTAALLIPAMFLFPEEAEEGGLAAYGPSLNELFLEVQLQQIVKLFRGTEVADSRSNSRPSSSW